MTTTTTPPPTAKGCNVCQKKGFPIFLARFAVGTGNAPHAAIPTPAGYPALNTSGAFYTLRNMRAGYVYLYDSLDGSLRCYIVSPDGFMAEHDLKLPKPAEKTTIDKACFSIPERMGNSTLITVPHADHKRKICIAYTEHLWTHKTCQQHIKSAKVRNHMIEITVGEGSTKTIPITQLGSAVSEYKLTNQEAVSSFTKWVSAPFYLLNNHTKSVITAADQLAPQKGVIVGLNDPVGLLADIDSLILYTNLDFDNRNKQPLVVYQTIVGIRNAIKAGASKGIKDEWDSRRAKVIEPYDPMSDPNFMPGMWSAPRVVEIIPKEKLPTLTAIEKQRQDKEIAAEQQSAWNKYKSFFHEQVAEDWFKTYTNAHEKLVNSQLIPLANVHVGWLKGDLLGDIMQYTFDTVNTQSGVDYTRSVKKMLGQTQLHEPCGTLHHTLMMGSASDLKNYILRGLVLNQQDVINEIQNQLSTFSVSQDDVKKLVWSSFFAAIGQRLDEKVIERAGDLNEFLSSITASVTKALRKVNSGQAVSQEFVLTLSAHTRKVFTQITYTDIKKNIITDLSKRIMETTKGKIKVDKGAMEHATKDQLVSMKSEGVNLGQKVSTNVIVMVDADELAKIDPTLPKADIAAAAQRAIKTPDNIKAMALRDWSEHNASKRKGGMGLATVGFILQGIATVCLWNDFKGAKGDDVVPAMAKLGAGLAANMGMVADEMTRQLTIKGSLALDGVKTFKTTIKVGTGFARGLLGAAAAVFAICDAFDAVKEFGKGNILRHLQNSTNSLN